MQLKTKQSPGGLIPLYPDERQHGWQLRVHPLEILEHHKISQIIIQCGASQLVYDSAKYAVWRIYLQLGGLYIYL
jgi:hypothetical protein